VKIVVWFVLFTADKMRSEPVTKTKTSGEHKETKRVKCRPISFVFSLSLALRVVKNWKKKQISL